MNAKKIKEKGMQLYWNPAKAFLSVWLEVEFGYLHLE